MRFKRDCRLKKKEDFDALFSSGKKLSHHPYLAFYKYASGERGRLGIVVPKRLIKQATRRNTVKRIVRESYRMAQFSLKRLEIVVLLRSECTVRDKKYKENQACRSLGLNKQRLRAEIDTLWLMLEQKCTLPAAG